jgi:hypothetical protein
MGGPSRWVEERNLRLPKPSPRVLRYVAFLELASKNDSYRQLARRNSPVTIAVVTREKKQNPPIRAGRQGFPEAMRNRTNKSSKVTLGVPPRS